jgi:prepilin-type processing-associated H-X9-DG protein
MSNYWNTVLVHHPLGVLSYAFLPAVVTLISIAWLGRRALPPRWLRRANGWLWAVTGVGLVMAAIGELACGGLRAEEMNCLSQEKELSLALLLYAEDWDERLPPADRWRSAAAAREGDHGKVLMRYRCPSDERPFAYAVNRNVAGAVPDWDKVKPAETVMIAEHPARGPNDTTASLSPEAFRHRGSTNVAYLDGHVIRANAHVASRLRW